MLLDFASPPSRLTPFISIFYRVRSDMAELRGVERADVGQIRFLLSGAGERCPVGGTNEAMAPVMVCGPGMGAAHYCSMGPSEMFGFSMRPAGWGAIVGLPAQQCTRRMLAGEAILGRTAGEMHAKLATLDGIDAMIACIAPVLIERAEANPLPPEHWRLIETVRLWLTAPGEIAVADLFAALPWSSRQTTRLVNHYFGGPPKFLARKFRALRAASALVEGVPVGEVASIFYDQSHMINEVRHFTGRTPGELRGHSDPLLAMTLSGAMFGELDPVPGAPYCAGHG